MYKLTVKKRFPAPRIDDLIFISSHQGRVLLENRPKVKISTIGVRSKKTFMKTALRLVFGHYEFLVMPFGLDKRNLRLLHEPLNRVKANDVADFEQEQETRNTIRVRAFVMTISLDITKQFLNAQTEAQKNKRTLKVKALGDKQKEASRSVIRQKCSAELKNDNQRIPKVEDNVMLKVSPWKEWDVIFKRLKQSRIPLVKGLMNSRVVADVHMGTVEDQFRRNILTFSPRPPPCHVLHLFVSLDGQGAF
ncbi:hypothetical protein Tco_0231019 [Tanacetum coccineum]